MLLHDKVALVTGASRGIGKAIAESFVEHGAAVVLVARSDSVLTLADQLCGAGGKAVAVVGEVARKEADDGITRAGSGLEPDGLAGAFNQLPHTEGR